MSDEDHGRRAAQASLVTRTFLIVAVLLHVTVIYLILSVGADTNRVVDNVEAQLESNAGTLRTSEKALETINDCTEPGGECFDRGTKRTAEAVGNIGRLSVYASACAANPGLLELSLEKRADSIERCVTRLLERTAQLQGEQ